MEPLLYEEVSINVASVFPAAKGTFLPCDVGQGESLPSLYQRRMKECQRARCDLRHRQIDLIMYKFAGVIGIPSDGYTFGWIFLSYMCDDHSTYLSQHLSNPNDTVSTPGQFGI